MLTSPHLPALSLLTLAISLILCPLANAAVNKGSSSSRLTWGEVTQGQGNVSSATNPASGAFDRQYLDANTSVAGYWSLGAGLEYGNVDDLFDLIDDTSESLTSGDEGGSSGGSSGSDVGYVIDDIDNPEFEALIDAARERATQVAAVLAFIQTEGYALAQAGTELAVLINSDVGGGTLRFDVTGWVNSSAIGLVEPIDFDREQALANLQATYDLSADDPITTYDLSGGLHLTIDPATRRVRASFDNDSLLLTRAAKLTEFALSYSRPLITNDSGVLFVGVRPKVTQIGLTRVTTRLGDLDDAEEAFDDIRHADFVTQTKAGIDLGLLWQNPRYRAGLTVTNLTQPTFDFPDIDYSDIENEEIRSALERTDSYEAERQYKLEGALLGEGQRWGLFAAYDANAVLDPAGVESQWGSLSGGYYFDNFWFNNARLGVSRNFSGSELSYLSAGVTMFRYVDLDLASTLKTTTLDGDNLPRGISLAVGLNYAF